MSIFYKIAFAAALILMFSMSGFAQYSTFIVDDDGNPATTYPTLQQAITTAEAFAGGPHSIKIMPGSYSDANITYNAAKIGAIYGDSASAAGDIVFTAPLATDNFINFGANLYIANLTIVGYNYALNGLDRSGMVVENVVFDGNARGVRLSSSGGSGSDNNTVQNCLFQNGTGWAVAIGSTSNGNLVDNNCFINNVSTGAAQAVDANGANTWSGNYWNDYNDLALGPYYLDGAGANTDATPDRYDNSADGPATVEVFDVVSYDINWSIPDCAAGDSVGLAAYEFTLSWNPAVLSFQSADYDEGLLGTTGAGALYTPIGGDPNTGTLVFAATNFTAPGYGDGRLAFVEFEAIGTGSTNLTVSSDYRDANNDPIAVQNTALTVTVTDTEAPVVVSFTPNDPIGDDTYSDGSTAGTEPKVQMYMEAQATDNYDLDRIQYQFNGAGTWYNLVTGLSGMSDGTAAPVYINITALPEGANYMSFRARDAAGTYSALVVYNFTIDRTGPALTAMLLSDADGCALDANYTNDPTVTVDLTTAAVDVAKMEFYEAGWQGPIAFAATSSYTLLNVTDGAKTVYARLYDVYGNMGNQTSDNITLDQAAPNPTNFLLAGGAAKTNTASITADAMFDNPNGTVEYNFSENAGDLVCGNGGWATTLPTAPHPFPVTLSAGDGVKTVYFAVRDLAGNISVVLSDDIELDATAPNLASIALSDPDGTTCSNSWTVDVTVAWTDADVASVKIKNDTAVAASYTTVNLVGETSPYTFSYTFTNPLRIANAVNTVYAYLVDDIANAGATSTASIFVDMANPSFASVEMFDLTSASSTWSNDAEVEVQMTGSVDITDIRFSEDNVTFGAWIPVDFSGGSVTMNYTFTAPVTQNAYLPLYVQGKDCSGRTGAGSDAGGIIFDLTAPVMSNFLINGGAAITNSTAATVTFSLVEVYTGLPTAVTLSEDPGFDTGDPTTVTFPYGGSYAITLSSGDGLKTVYGKFEDQAGNVSAVVSDDIMLDMTAPSGTFTVVSTNPLAVLGYTSTAAVTIQSIAYDGDVTQMQLRNVEAGGSALTAWMAAAASYSPWTLGTGPGLMNVQMRFRDAANNIGAWQTVSIDLNPAPPAPPAAAVGTPTGSTELSWTAVTNAQKYEVRYNFTNEYPAFTSGLPPNPATRGAGIFAVQTAETAYTFEGPQPDIYAFTIWTLSKHGLWSTTGNMDVVATNYILGDFYNSGAAAMGPDGCIDFGDEFGALAIAYNSVSPSTYYNPYLDIAPTSDATSLGYPIPDLAVDFEDLIIFALNYDEHRCAKSGIQFDMGDSRLLAGVPSTLDLSAGVPTRIAAGSDIIVPVSVNYAEAIKGFHIVLGYNNADFDLVRVESGEIYSGVEESFFYFDRNSDKIDISGVVLGYDAAFEGQEMFRIVLHANAEAELNLDDVELTLRDAANHDIQAAFSTNPLHNGGLPTAFELAQNYPNPFNPTTTIEMALPTASDYRLTIYNVLGQTVRTFEGRADAGYVTIQWDASNNSSGIYLYKMEAGTYEVTKKMVLLK